MLTFYDFEVFKHNWMVVLIDPEHIDTPVEVVDDADALTAYYESHMNDIWVGFNSRHYDQYILKGILTGCKPWDINEHIIIKHQPGWSYSSLLRKIFLINYDVMPLNSSLKQLEGMQGHNIYESGVDFRIDRPLTPEDIRETLQYCRNDVLETMNIFSANISDFNALLWLVKEFNFPLSYMSKTKAQISAEILECEPVERTDEWDIQVLPCIQLKDRDRTLTVKRKKKKDDPEDSGDKKVETIQGRPDRWFMTHKYQDYRYYFICKVAGVDHQFGWGGIHGARKQYHYRCDADHLMLHVDVASYYPRLMIFHHLLTRNAKRPERFPEIYHQRLKLKREGKKKEQAPLKIVINGTFGICKDPTNKAFDPRNANLICVNGQLMLLDLIEHLEAIDSFELIQSNTDGLIIKIHRDDFDQVDDVCYEWESRCNMELEFDYIQEIWQKDVNNYVFTQYDGKIERKGAYVKDLNPLDNDLPIINKALVEYMLHGIPVEQTIGSCDELIQFQKICKLSAKYDYVTHNGRKYYNKCYRVFASTREKDGPVKKVKPGREDKFGNTSMHSFLDGSDITGAPVPAYLDRQWYIELAEKRLRQYGV